MNPQADKLAILHLTATNEVLRASNLCIKEALEKILEIQITGYSADIITAQALASQGLGAASVAYGDPKEIFKFSASPTLTFSRKKIENYIDLIELGDMATVRELLRTALITQ